MKVCTRSRLFASPSPLRRLKCDMSPLFLDRSDTSTGADRKRDYCRKSDLPYSCSCQRGRASAGLRHPAPRRAARLSICAAAALAKICTQHHASTASSIAHTTQRLHAPLPVHPNRTHTRTRDHIGNSSGVGVQIITNADESSFCEPSPAFCC